MFVDLEKVQNRVSREKIWVVLLHPELTAAWYWLMSLQKPIHCALQ